MATRIRALDDATSAEVSSGKFVIQPTDTGGNPTHAKGATLTQVLAGVSAAGGNVFVESGIAAPEEPDGGFTANDLWIQINHEYDAIDNPAVNSNFAASFRKRNDDNDGWLPISSANTILNSGIGSGTGAPDQTLAGNVEWYLRTGSTTPGLYHWDGSSWSLVANVGSGGGSVTLDQASLYNLMTGNTVPGYSDLTDGAIAFVALDGDGSVRPGGSGGMIRFGLGELLAYFRTQITGGGSVGVDDWELRSPKAEHVGQFSITNDDQSIPAGSFFVDPTDSNMAYQRGTHSRANALFGTANAVKVGGIIRFRKDLGSGNRLDVDYEITRAGFEAQTTTDRWWFNSTKRLNRSVGAGPAARTEVDVFYIPPPNTDDVLVAGSNITLTEGNDGRITIAGSASGGGSADGRTYIGNSTPTAPSDGFNQNDVWIQPNAHGSQGAQTDVAEQELQTINFHRRNPANDAWIGATAGFSRWGYSSAIPATGEHTNYDWLIVHSSSADGIYWRNGNNNAWTRVVDTTAHLLDVEDWQIRAPRERQLGAVSLSVDDNSIPVGGFLADPGAVTNTVIFHDGDSVNAGLRAVFGNLTHTKVGGIIRFRRDLTSGNRLDIDYEITEAPAARSGATDQYAWSNLRRIDRSVGVSAGTAYTNVDVAYVPPITFSDLFTAGANITISHANDGKITIAATGGGGTADGRGYIGTSAPTAPSDGFNANDIWIEPGEDVAIVGAGDLQEGRAGAITFHRRNSSNDNWEGTTQGSSRWGHLDGGLPSTGAYTAFDFLVVSDSSANGIYRRHGSNSEWSLAIAIGSGSSASFDLAAFDRLPAAPTADLDIANLEVLGKDGDSGSERLVRLTGNTLRTLLRIPDITILHGDQSNRPAASSAGRIYLQEDATHGNGVYRDDGSDWQLISDVDDDLDADELLAAWGVVPSSGTNTLDANDEVLTRVLGPTNEIRRISISSLLSLISQANAYAAIKDILVAGTNITLDEQDGTHSITIAAAGGGGGGNQVIMAATTLYSQNLTLQSDSYDWTSFDTTTNWNDYEWLLFKWGGHHGNHNDFPHAYRLVRTADITALNTQTAGQARSVDPGDSFRLFSSAEAGGGVWLGRVDANTLLVAADAGHDPEPLVVLGMSVSTLSNTAFPARTADASATLAKTEHAIASFFDTRVAALISNDAIPASGASTTAAPTQAAVRTALTAVDDDIPDPATATPLAPAETALVGSSDKFAREDHVHPEQSIPDVPDASDANPANLGTAGPGNSDDFSRANHVHQTEVSNDALPSSGGSTTLAPSIAAVRTAIAAINTGGGDGSDITVSDDAPDDSNGDNGDIYVRTGQHHPGIYVKLAGAWRFAAPSRVHVSASEPTDITYPGELWIQHAIDTSQRGVEINFHRRNSENTEWTNLNFPTESLRIVQHATTGPQVGDTSADLWIVSGGNDKGIYLRTGGTWALIFNDTGSVNDADFPATGGNRAQAKSERSILAAIVARISARISNSAIPASGGSTSNAPSIAAVRAAITALTIPTVSDSDIPDSGGSTSQAPSIAAVARKISAIPNTGGGGDAPDAATEAPLPPAASADVGDSDKYAREDHVHPQQAVPAASNANPQGAGNASPGNNAPYAREDHIHPSQVSDHPIPANGGSATQAPSVAQVRTAIDAVSTHLGGITDQSPMWAKFTVTRNLFNNSNIEHEITSAGRAVFTERRTPDSTRDDAPDTELPIHVGNQNYARPPNTIGLIVEAWANTADDGDPAVWALRDTIFWAWGPNTRGSSGATEAIIINLLASNGRGERGEFRLQWDQEAEREKIVANVQTGFGLQETPPVEIRLFGAGVYGSGGGTTPEPPADSHDFLYGLADAAGAKVTPPTEATIANAGAVVRVTTPGLTATGVRAYFELASGRTLTGVFNVAFGGRTDETADWTQVSGTNRYIGPQTGRIGQVWQLEIDSTG